MQQHLKRFRLTQKNEQSLLNSGDYVSLHVAPQKTARVSTKYIDSSLIINRTLKSGRKVLLTTRTRTPALNSP